jgi:hypothetical protein
MAQGVKMPLIMIKLIVAGSRTFADYSLLKQKLDFYLQAYLPSGDVEIVSGKARGADTLGERYAREHHLPLKQFPADWERFGRAAGYRRNEMMVSYATHCICFWDGISKGTAHAISLAKRQGLVLRVVRY